MVELDVPRELVVVRVGDEKPVKVPLTAFEMPEEGSRPSVIEDEAWEDAKGSASSVLGSPLSFETAKFTGSDTLAVAGQIHRNKPSQSSKGALGSSANTHRKPRQRRRKQGDDDQQKASESARKQRRRRSTKISGGEATTEKVQRSDQKKDAKLTTKSKAKGKSGSANKDLRPGHRSSALSQEASQAKEGQKPRRRRRRRSKGQGQASQGGTDAAKGGS